MKRTQWMKRKGLGLVLALSLTMTGLIGGQNMSFACVEAEAASALKVNLSNNQEMWLVNGEGERVGVRVTAGAAGPIKCTTSNSKVVSVAGSVLTAEKAGKAKITIKSGKGKVTRNVVVKSYKSDKSIMSLKDFQRESDSCASVVVKNKTDRPLVVSVDLVGYDKNWKKVYDGVGNCYVSVNGKGEQRVYFRLWSMLNFPLLK